MQDLTGFTLGNYRLLKKIGEGGQAVVYQAQHVNQGYHVALKVMSPQLAQNNDFRKRFLREMQVMSHLRHHHIVPVYEVGESQGYLFMASELMQSSLDKQLVGNRASGVATTVSILQNIASALDYAHGRGVVHRDVKPANILFAGDNRAVLTDFGIARVAGFSTMTASGLAIGTADYVSPEQAQGHKQLDYRTDIYSLGIVAYQMLTGHATFHRENTMATLLAHITEQPPSMRQWNPSLSPAVDQVVLKALAKNPSQRYRSAGAFAHAVTRAVSTHSGVGKEKEYPPQKHTHHPRQAQRIDSKVLWIGGALALIAIVFIILTMWPPPNGNGPASPSSPPSSGPLIAFESDQNGNKEIYVADPQGQKRWRLTRDPGLDWSPVWSSDGQSLAFVSDRTGSMDIYTMDRQGTGVRNLTNTTSNDSGPAWSTNQRIAFDSDRSGNSDIYVMNADGSLPTNLTEHPAFDGDPSWPPDNQHLVFESDRDGNYELYRMSVSGGSVQRLTSDAWKDFAPAWSPDGRYIIYECHISGSEICRIDSSGTNRKRLTTNDYEDRQPSWSPDGNEIIWVRTNPLTGSDDLFVMDVNGENVRVLPSPWNEAAPVWTR